MVSYNKLLSLLTYKYFSVTLFVGNVWKSNIFLDWLNNAEYNTINIYNKICTKKSRVPKTRLLHSTVNIQLQKFTYTDMNFIMDMNFMNIEQVFLCLVEGSNNLVCRF